jgi:Arc-like DNA binding domain
MKDSTTIKLNLRLPKKLHRHLVQRAKRNKTSLNTEIIDTLERSRGQHSPPDVIQQMAVMSRHLDSLVAQMDKAVQATAGAATVYDPGHPTEIPSANPPKDEKK